MAKHIPRLPCRIKALSWVTGNGALWGTHFQWLFFVSMIARVYCYAMNQYSTNFAYFFVIRHVIRSILTMGETSGNKNASKAPQKYRADSEGDNTSTVIAGNTRDRHISEQGKLPWRFKDSSFWWLTRSFPPMASWSPWWGFQRGMAQTPARAGNNSRSLEYQEAKDEESQAMALMESFFKLSRT